MISVRQDLSGERLREDYITSSSVPGLWPAADPTANGALGSQDGALGHFITSVPTMWVRSSGCSMMDIKDSPRFVETNMWAMANRRSGRKA